MKNTVTKNLLESFNSRMEMTKGRVSEFEDKSVQTIQSKYQRERSGKNEELLRS